MMKRLFALILAVLMFFCFVGCSKEKTENVSKVETEAEKSAATGTIPDLKFQLGAHPDDIEDYYDEFFSRNEGTDEYLNRQEGELTVLLETNSIKYYYEKAKKENGISFMAVLADCLGYERGVIMAEDIKNDFRAQGELNDATEDQMFFLPSYEENCKVLSYTFGKYKLEFYFVDDFLSATVIYDTENWTV